MTLTSIVAAACEKARKTDADTLAFALDCARRRMELVWRDKLWKASLRVVTVSVTPAINALHAEGVVMMPAVIERVCGVRSGDWPLAPAPLEVWSRTALDEWVQTGTPQAYSILKPVVWCWSATGGKPFIECASTDDTTVLLSLRYVDPNGALQRPVSGIYADWFTGATSFSNAPYVTPSDVVELQWLSKPASAGAFLLRADTAGGELICTIGASDKAAPTRARIRLVNPPNAAVTLKVLGKDRLSTWEEEEDCPLPGAEDAIMAFVKGDVLDRFRQGSSAAAAVQEAGALLAQLAQVEVLQEATRVRLIPEVEGMGMNADFVSKGYW
jgi:hypothetical protein